MSEPAQAQDTSAESPWALSTYSGKLKAHIEAAPPTWVEGQLVEFNLRNGNAWMTLRDLEKEVSFSTVAWRTVAGGLNGTVQPGSRVVALVKPNLYEKSGRLSLVAHQMKPVGLGDLLARIEQLKQRLAEEGLFREDRKRPLPILPLRIGLITGRNSDAKKDILRNTHTRWAAAQFEIREVATQGPTAPQEVTDALLELDADPAVEVIVIARGGGALEEVVLPFSDERLIRAVAAAETPVVSAIGHEADRPLLDDVADMRASTPTGAAKLLVVDAAQERDALTHARGRMSAGVERLITRETQWLQTQRSRPVLAQPQGMITGRAQELRMLRRRSLFGIETAVRRDTDWVGQTRARARSLSPQSTLDRGYAVVQTESAAGREVLREASTVAVGDRLSIMVASGELTARAEEIHPEDRRAAHPEQDRNSTPTM